MIGEVVSEVVGEVMGGEVVWYEVDLMRDQLEGLEIQPDEHAWDERDDDREEEDEAKEKRARVDVGERVFWREEQRGGLQNAAWPREYPCAGACAVRVGGVWAARKAGAGNAEARGRPAGRRRASDGKRVGGSPRNDGRT